MQLEDGDYQEDPCAATDPLNKVCFNRSSFNIVIGVSYAWEYISPCHLINWPMSGSCCSTSFCCPKVFVLVRQYCHNQASRCNAFWLADKSYGICVWFHQATLGKRWGIFWAIVSGRSLKVNFVSIICINLITSWLSLVLLDSILIVSNFLGCFYSWYSVGRSHFSCPMVILVCLMLMLKFTSWFCRLSQILRKVWFNLP